MRYAKKRSYEWSPSVAYSVGLIASDGCLQKDGRHIDLTSVDLEQLDNFSKALGRVLRISRKVNSSQQPAYRVQFSDVAYYDFLLEAGLTPAKSKIIPKLNIPFAFYADFLRGLFDGDGSTYGYMDPRWRSSYMFYVSFTSASWGFISSIQQTNSELIDVTQASIRNGKRAYNLVYAKADSYKIQRYMYYNDAVICLSRKRLKLERFMKEAENAIIFSANARVVKSVNTQP